MTHPPVNVSLSFRTVRIGTLKTFALSREDVLKFDCKRLKFAVKLRPETSDPDETLKVVIPCKHITYIKSYLGRGCPVIWLQTNEECTKYLRRTTGMKKGRIPSPFYDPLSQVMAERYVGIIVAEDPIPCREAYLFKEVVQKIYQDRDLVEEDFHGKITFSLCNSMLVEVTSIADRIYMFQQTAKSEPDIDINRNLYKELKFSSSILTKPSQPREEPREKSRQEELDDLPESVPTAIISAQNSPVTSPTSFNKNVNRARKSIPKSNRSISLESQLDEIRAKAGLNPQAKQVQMLNLKHSKSSPVITQSPNDTPQEIVSDDAGNSSSTSITTVKKKRPKDPFLWKGRGKRRVKKSSDQMTYRTPGSESPKAGQTVRTPLTATCASTYNNKKSSYFHQQVEESHEQISGRYSATELCSCAEKSPFVVMTGSDALKCMGFDNVDGRLTACSDVVTAPMMVKASQHVPALALCDIHRERMRRHECCPGCGTFCAGGSFLVCISTKECPHRFHKDCMLLHRQTKDCLHCGGPMSLVRDLYIDPGQDHKLRWVIAGQDPNKMEKKRLLAGREKTARMGHRSGCIEAPVDDGVIKMIRPGVTVNTSSLPPGEERDALEAALYDLYETSLEKAKVLPKSVSQLIQQGDIVKLIQFFNEAEEHEIRNVIKHPSSLNKAVQNGQLAVVYLLILVGAKPSMKDNKGKSALFFAEEKEHVELMEYLISNGANIRDKDSDGVTCFHQAAKHGHIVSCSILLQHDPDIINMPDEGGWTPVVWAAEHGQTGTAKYLEYFSADVSITDKEENTCLHWAALSGNLDLLVMCLRKHCDINHKNILGDTALHIAARRDHSNCVVCLTGWGADHTLKNNDRKTPFECTLPDTYSRLLLQFQSKISTAMSNQDSTDKERMMCSDLSRGFENLPVSCVNSVDDSPCPTDSPDGFQYVITNVHTSQETIIKDPNSKMQSCQCFSQCMNDSCLCCLLSERCWYDGDGLLVPEFDMLEPPLVFECSKTCWCPPSCPNRVVQNGIRYNLQIHRTRSMGWSVRTLDTIPRGAFVCEYVGELISDAEADIREDDSYLFDLENKDGEIFCIDARYYGNVSRFINHLCNPNLVPIRVFIDHHDIRFPRLAYFSTREIKAGEELGFDYGDRFWDIKCRQFTCGCGLPQCKYSEEAYRLKKELEEKRKNEGKEQEDKDADGFEVESS